VANLLTPEGVLLAHSLFEAKLGKKPKPSDRPKYWARVGFTVEAVNDPKFQAIANAVREAAREAWGRDRADAMWKEGSIRSPFRKDVAAKGYPGWVAIWIGSSSLESMPPAIVGRFTFVDPADGKTKLKPITDKRLVYAGCKCRMSLATRAYGAPGGEYSPGLSLDLRNFQLLGDGERLVAGTDANEDFDGEPEPSAADPNGGALDGML
jgi:hypothetical protein